MDEQLYEELIYEYLFRMMAHLYEVICVVHQDNDPTHNLKLCKLCSRKIILNEFVVQYLAIRQNK